MALFKSFTRKLIFITLCLLVQNTYALIDANKVFQLNTQIRSDSIILQFKIAPKHFLYQERIQLSPATTINWPKALKHTDKMGITHLVYRDGLKLQISKPKSQKLEISYQGCSDKGLCYPPLHQSILLPKTLDLYQKITILIGFLGLGLLLAFTPCVLPMLPVMAQVVIGKENTSKSKMFFLALSYVMGMSLSYGIVGAILAKIGKNTVVSLQTPLIMGLMALIYLYLGCATLDLFKIKLPARLQTQAMNWRTKLSSGHYYSAALIGALSLLILSPCITAPTLAAMTYITQLGQAWMGSIALMMLGLGMGLPLMIFTLSAGHLLPKAGPWMEKVKLILALLLFGVSILLIERAIQHPFTHYLWLIWFGILAYLFKPKTHQPVYFGLSVLLSLILGLLLHHQQPHLHQLANINRLNDLEAKLQQSHKPSLLYFSAKWCASCQYIEKNVLSKRELETLLSHYQVIKVDLSEHNEEQARLMQNFNVIAPPTIIRLNPKESARLSGEEITISHLLDLEKN
jgi:thiol:disulfide interchange protein DsbD